MNQAVTGYRYDNDTQTMVPVWGPPALESAKPKSTVAKSGVPKPDKVITDWSMPGKIFRIKAHLHLPDGRYVVVYGNSFDHCMKLLEEESKNGLPYTVEVTYDGKITRLWNRTERDSDQWGSDCCKDIVDEMLRRAREDAKMAGEAVIATRVRELEACA